MEIENVEWAQTVIQPILDRWNKVHHDDWHISDTDDGHIILICDKKPDYMHGILITELGGLCNAYDWHWYISYWDGHQRFGIY